MLDKAPHTDYIVSTFVETQRGPVRAGPFLVPVEGQREKNSQLSKPQAQGATNGHGLCSFSFVETRSTMQLRHDCHTTDYWARVAEL